MGSYTVLLVEDQTVQRQALTAHLQEEKYQVLPAESAEEALEIAGTSTVDAVITDFNLPGKDGQSLLEQMTSVNPMVPVILITAYASIDGAVHAMQSGAYHYLTKPVNPSQILLACKKLLDKKKYHG